MSNTESLHRFFHLCTNRQCAALMAVESYRPRAGVMCVLCSASTTPAFGVKLAEDTPCLNMGNGTAVIGGALAMLTGRATPRTHNLPHSAWLEVVERITLKWLMASIAYNGTSWAAGTADEPEGTIHAIFDAEAAAEAFEEVNTERAVHGLRPLTWEDVRNEAEKE